MNQHLKDTIARWGAGKSSPSGRIGGSSWTNGSAILSYKTAILTSRKVGMGALFNGTKYSPTTSRVQKALRSVLPALVEEWTELDHIPMGDASFSAMDKEGERCRMRERARYTWAGEHSADPGIQIDDDAVVSPSEGGSWVAAWVWLDEEVTNG